MIMKPFVFIVVLLAIGTGFFVAIAAGPDSKLTQDALIKFASFRIFFETALPILAFGSLIKYLCTGCMKCSNCPCKSCCDDKQKPSTAV